MSTEERFFLPPYSSFKFRVEFKDNGTVLRSGTIPATQATTVIGHSTVNRSLVIPDVNIFADSHVRVFLDICLPGEIECTSRKDYVPPVFSAGGKAKSQNPGHISSRYLLKVFTQSPIKSILCLPLRKEY